MKDVNAEAFAAENRCHVVLYFPNVFDIRVRAGEEFELYGTRYEVVAVDFDMQLIGAQEVRS